MTLPDRDHVPIGRRAFIYLDFCFYAYCNFTCTYCRDTNEHMSKGKGRTAFDQAVTDFLARNSAAVFKISGYGEATLWPKLPETVAAWSPQFPCIQLISNGAGPRHVFDRFCELPNFQACITLDGHTAKLDRFRTRDNASLHRRVVRTVDRLVASGIRVELNCVITQANADHLDTYLEWVSHTWGNAVMVIPFPVRPTLGRTMSDIHDVLVATPSQWNAVEDTLVGRYPEFSLVLPPLSYTSRMVDFMRASHRQALCHVHRANFGVNTQLQALACACAGDRLIVPLGPVSAVGTDPNVERRQRQYLRDGNVGAKCRTCFTHYDLINLYLDGSLSDDEVARIPSLSSPGALAHLRAVKADIAPYLEMAEMARAGPDA